MFKKRLKGLLAMALAGSIALSALPMSASATISANYVKVCEVNRYNSTPVRYYELQKNESVSPYLNENNLWGVYYSYSYYDSGYTPAKELSATGTEAFSGDALVDKFDGFADTNINDYSDIKITAQHKYIVTTDDPSATVISAKSALTTSTFPVEIPLTDYDFANPLMDYSCTPWYSTTDAYGNIYSQYAVKSTDEPVRFSAGDESIFIGMDTFKGLYSADIDTANQNDAIEIFLNGITIFQLKAEYKTLDIPVLNVFGNPEMDGENPYTISVTEDSYDDLETYDKFFYVGYTNKDGKVVLSDYTVNNKARAWAIIEGFAENDPNFDANTLFFLRSLNVSVYKDFSEIGSFNSRDLLLAANDGKKPAAYEYLEAADPHSIWRGLQEYVLGKDLLKEIETYLDNNHGLYGISLTETTEIVVTGTKPVQNETTESYARSPLYVEDTDPEQTVPATISDHAAVLEKAGLLAAGNIYDTSGWQLWGCGFTSGDVKRVVFLKKSALESTDGGDSIGIDQLNTVPDGSPLLYIPQVQIAPSLEVTAPVAGETPSFEYKIVDNVGGYSVVSVEWSCGNTLLDENDKFEAGKKYTVRFELSADVNLLFVDSTPVTINGEKADTSYEEIVGFSARYTFPALPPVAVAGHSLVLADSIGVKFYMELADDLLTDNTAKMTFTVNGRQTVIPVSEGQRVTLNDRTVYAFTCYVAAAEMTDQITAQVTAADYSSEEFTYNVQTYAQYILDNSNDYSKYVPVVKAMLNYGAEAQKYFKHNAETPANNILDEGDKMTAPVTLSELESYDYTCSDKDADIDFAGYTISLKSRITAKLYFRGAGLTKDKITVLAGEQEVDSSRLTVGSDSNGTYLAISDINAGDFDQCFTVRVGGITIDNFSVYSYLFECLKNDSTDLISLVDTLYAYNEAV